MIFGISKYSQLRQFESLEEFDEPGFCEQRLASTPAGSGLICLARTRFYGEVPRERAARRGEPCVSVPDSQSSQDSALGADTRVWPYGYRIGYWSLTKNAGQVSESIFCGETA